jgi:hypothetical protein
MFELTGNQIRRGRELLNLSRWRLSTNCGISPVILKSWEDASDNPPSALWPNLSRVLRYMRDQGVVFGDDGEVTIETRSARPCAPLSSAGVSARG